MHRLARLAFTAFMLVVAVGCAANRQAPADTSADEAAVRAINPQWFTAYNAGDAAAVTALYADDAVLSVPGLAPARGTGAIRAAYDTDVAAAAAAGVTFTPGPNPEFSVSRDLAYEWNTYTVVDKAGATVDKGKYLTVYGKRDGKWAIVSDIWNSDTPPPAAPAAAPSTAAPAK